MIIQIDFGVGQTNVGYQFYDAAGLIGARVTAGITSPGVGVYVATATPGAGAIGVYWDCDDADFTAVEDLSERIIVETNLNATINSRSSHSAADVWAVTTRSLTSYGTLVADVVAAVWAATTRTLSAYSDSSGVTTLLSRIASALTITSGKVDVNDKTGFGLSTGERDALAAVVEAHLLDEGDSQLLINAIVGAIGNTNIDQAVLIAALRADLERVGGSLKLIEGKTTNLPADPASNTQVGTRSSHSAADVWASVSRTLSGFGFTVNTNPNATETAIKAKTDNLPASPAATSDIPSAASVAALVTTDHGAGSYVRNTEPPSVAAIAAQIIADHGAGSYADSSSGTGALSVSVTVTVGVSPLENARVRLTEGVNSFVALTNASGIATFAVDAATYAVSITKAGYQFTPSNIVVTPSATAFAKQMTAIVIPIPADPNQSTGYITTRDEKGDAKANVELEFQMTAHPSTDAHSNFAFRAVSDENGLLAQVFARGATYQGRRGGNGAWVTFVVANVDTFQLPAVLGNP